KVSADPAPGWISLGPCPGRTDEGRDLDTDLATISASGADVLVTLTEQLELDELGVGDLGQRATARGFAWLHLPITDFGAPDAIWEAAWVQAGPLVRARVKEGGGVHLHCRAGCGRSGMITARILVELGVSPGEAIARVRAARPCAIETAGQEAVVRSTIRL
ncbi:MAG: phosphatase, partial [Proteobacteria bacterium]|nr:phosphatase [Pseudomonadota bacterium]